MFFACDGNLGLGGGVDHYIGILGPVSLLKDGAGTEAEGGNTRWQILQLSSFTSTSGSGFVATAKVTAPQWAVAKIYL